MLRKTTSSLLLTAALAFAAGTAQAEGFSLAAKTGDKKFSAGIEFDDQASAEQTGLPVYPGARRDRDDVRNADNVNLGFWGGDFGVKLVVVKMESNDKPEQVAEFYRRALGEFGPVLDCSRAKSRETPRPREKSKGPKPLDCDSDRGEKNGQLYKAGTRRNQHIVSIQSRGPGTAFQLIHVEVRGLD
ncbi:MAG: hypothetical protein JNN20_12585 [Betaproteobacteria bacterium]|nr:hypothetical protein [Betaproteobacteria bacterium]